MTEAGVRLQMAHISPLSLALQYSTLHYCLWSHIILSGDLLQLLKPRNDAFHIIVYGLFNVIQHRLI